MELLADINLKYLGTTEGIVSDMTLLNNELIVKKNGEKYIMEDNIKEYIEIVNSRLYTDDEPYKICMPYNLLKVSGYFEYNSPFLNICIEYIDSYIDYLTNLNNDYSQQILKEIIVNGYVDIIHCSYSFGTLFLLLGKKYMLNIKNNNNISYDDLFEGHKRILMLNNPREFMIDKLEKVIGNKDIATILIDTYNGECMSFDHVSCLILWKDEESKEEYIKYIKEKYNIVDDKLNFEGFNKFMLNIKEEHVKQWEVKEEVNNLYYNITKELIHGYEELYKYKL